MSTELNHPGDSDFWQGEFAAMADIPRGSRLNIVPERTAFQTGSDDEGQDEEDDRDYQTV